MPATPIPGTMMTTSELFAMRPQYTRATDATCCKPILESDSAAEGDQDRQEKHGDSVTFSDVRVPKECACFCGQHSKLKNYHRSKSVDPDFKYLQQSQCNECARNATETAVRLKRNHKQGDDGFQKTVTYYETDETDSSFQKTVNFANEDENDEKEMCPGQERGPTKQFDECASPLVDKDIETKSPRRRRKCKCLKWKCAVVGVCLAVLFIAVCVIIVKIKSTGSDNTKPSTPSAFQDTKGEVSGNTTTVSSISIMNCKSLSMPIDYTQFEKDPVKRDHQYIVPWGSATNSEQSIFIYSKEKRSLTVTESGRYRVSVVMHFDSFSWLSNEDNNEVFIVQMCLIISHVDKQPQCTKRTLTPKLILDAEIIEIIHLNQNQSVKVVITADDKRIVHQDKNFSKLTITSNDCK